jgi:AraC family transcriptional regulator of adaptative response/methylated-DNA-[protein]-cysteine methyltransferase
MLALTTTPAMPQAASADDRRWLDVAARSRAADGAFVYAVTSTGVYCRPSCPSRRPRRDRVRFFAAPADAERAGFRACLRCRPAAPRPTAPATRAVAQAASYLRAHAADEVSLAGLAARVGLSPSHLQRAFTAHTGVSPREFQAACRAERFRASLRAGHDVTRATYDAGYGSPSRVSGRRPTGTGLTPGAYRKGAPGTTITCTVLPCTLGRLLVASTARGVCAVKLGDSEAALVADLRTEFPKADIRRDGTANRWARAIVAALDRRPAVSPDVPLDVQSTAFQWQVWKALREIPPGQVRTYAEVASAIGQPKAVRAVARACAANPVALVVPCHRVVPAAGGTGGYRWGPERKARLLESEALA